jgi:putative flippase GtrA
MSRTGQRFVGFFFVALAGLAIDIAMAWGLHRFAGLPLLVSATVGFFVATVFNYLVNLNLTFADRSLRPSLRGFATYLLSVLAGLATRLVVLALLQWLVPPALQYSLVLLIVAAAASFVVNFLIANRWAFSE